MAFYIVSRTGWNAANQSSRGYPRVMPVCKVEADSPEAAVKLALERVTCYNNQFLSAELASEVEAREAAIDAAVELL